MDFDGNGTIEAEELADIIQNDAVTPLILPLLDNDDGDGKVTPEEFRTFFDVWGDGGPRRGDGTRHVRKFTKGAGRSHAGGL